MRDILAKISSFNLLFVWKFWHFLNCIDKLRVTNYAEQNLLKMENDSCKIVQENLKLAMK